jgi:hypothetical protein
LDGLQSRSGVGGEEKVFAPFKNGTRSPNPVLGLVTVVSEITQIQLFKSEIYFFRVYRLVLERKKTINFVISVCISWNFPHSAAIPPVLHACVHPFIFSGIKLVFIVIKLQEPG